MFTISKNHESVLKQVLKAAKSDGYIQAFNNAHITAKNGIVTIICGDGAIELTAELKDCNVTSDGVVCVDSVKFAQSLAACKYECQVLFKDGFVEVKNSKSKFKLMSVNPESYPSYPEIGKQSKLEINGSQLIDSIKSAAIIAPDNDVRHFLNGVKIGSSVCATDGHRLIRLDSEQCQDAIIPIKAIKSLPDIIGDIYLSDNFISIKSDVITFKSKLIDGRFPDVDRAIQKPEKMAIIDSGELKDAVRSAIITANKTTNAIRIEINPDGGKVTASGQNNEQSFISFDADTSDHIEMAFNAKYILDAMSYYTGKIEICFSAGQMIIKTDGMTNVVMGMRL
jgi:DNA polymerase-3 subunit beta